MTKDEKFALSWCYTKAIDYVEKHSPIDNPYPHHTGPLDLIVDSVNIAEIMRRLINDQ